MTNLTSTNDGPGRFTPGELVDVNIKGARVLDEPTTTTVRVEWNVGPASGLRAIVYRRDVTRVAPAEWPPQPADVWRDREGDAWVVAGDFEDGVEMALATFPSATWQSPEHVMGSFGPMRLEYRPGWTPTTAAAVEPAEVDVRDEQVAALRELADLLDRNPVLRAPYRITVGAGSIVGLRQWAYALDVEVTAHPHNDTIQWWADKTIRGLEIHAYWIDDSPSLAAANDAMVEAEIADREADAADLPSVEEYEEATAADVVAAATDDRGDPERLADAAPDSGCDCFAPVLPDGWAPYIGGGYIHEPTGNLSREIPTQRDPNPPFLADGTPNPSAG